MATVHTVNSEVMSLKVSRALSNMGYSDKDVENRIMMWEKINNLGYQTNRCDQFLLDPSLEELPFDVFLSWKIAGSKITGLSTMLEGDIDVMHYLRILSTRYQKDSIVQIESDNCPPGYCKLLLCQHGLENLNRYKTRVGSRQKEKIYLSSEYIKSVMRKQFKREGKVSGERGPAFRVSNPGRSAMDIVFAISFEKLPTAVSDWITRRRVWPSHNMISDIIVKGCEVVPIGDPENLRESFLWRLSFSYAEKLLMQNLNGPQRKTYILLKRFITEAVNPKLDTNVISSYIVKMLIFWMVEMKPKEFWNEYAIIDRFLDGLQFLKRCVDKESFPHYFVVKRNMFEHQLTTKNKKCISSLLSAYIAEGPLCLSNCTSVYGEMQRFSSMNPGLLNFYIAISNRRVAEDIFALKYLVMECILHLSQVITYYEEGEITTFSPRSRKEDLRRIYEFIRNERSFGKTLISISTKMERYNFPNVRHRHVIENLKTDVVKLLRNTNVTSVAGKVRLVLATCAMGRFDVAYYALKAIIASVESRPGDWIPLTTKGQYINERTVKHSSDGTVEMHLETKCLSELIFNYDTSWLVPQGVRYHHFLDPAEDVEDDKNLIKVDCMAIAYYLFAFVAVRLGQEKEADLAIHKLLLGAKGKRDHQSLNFEYRETALNMACHLLMERGNYCSAVKLIRHSIMTAIKMGSSPYPSVLLLSTLLRKSFQDYEDNSPTQTNDRHSYLLKLIRTLTNQYILVPVLLSVTLVFFINPFRRMRRFW